MAHTIVTDNSAKNLAFTPYLATNSTLPNPVGVASQMQVVRCRAHYIATFMQVPKTYFDYSSLINNSISRSLDFRPLQISYKPKTPKWMSTTSFHCSLTSLRLLDIYTYLQLYPMHSVCLVPSRHSDSAFLASSDILGLYY